MADKKYAGKIGIDNFYYAVLDDNDSVVGLAPERIEFLQQASIEFSQEIVRAYGDNRTAEIAVSNGNLSVSTQFHTVPQEDQDVIFGAEVVEGISAYGGNDTPPNIAVVFEVTHSDGGSSWLGLAKGKFTRPTEEGATKEDSITFGSDSVSGEFIDRDVDGFTEPKSYLKGYDAKGETASRDAIFQKVFGLAYPVETVPAG